MRLLLTTSSTDWHGRLGIVHTALTRSVFVPLLLVPALALPLTETEEGRSAALSTSGTTSKQAQKAPDSRAEEWRQRRLERSQKIVPNQPNSAEKAFLRLENDSFRETLNIRWKDFYPKIGNLSDGSGFALGLRHFKSRLTKANLSVQTSGAASFSSYRLASFEFGRFKQVAPFLFLGPNEFASPFKFGDERERESDLFLYFNLRYRYFPQETFFGIGPDPLEEETSYLIEDAAYDVVAGYRHGRFGVAGRAGYLQVNIGEGTDDDPLSLREAFDDLSAPGLDRQPDFLRGNAAVFFDFRDNPGNPHNGGVLGLVYTHFNDRGGSEFEFNRITLDARQYIPLGSRQRVLALRFFGSSDETEGASRVPFYLQRTLGGYETLRGFPQFQFRDERLLYLSAEYRWEAWPAVEFALFYDAGKVFPNTEDFDFENLEKSVGGGVRFKTSRRTFLRFDVGRGQGKTLIHFRFGPSF